LDDDYDFSLVIVKNTPSLAQFFSQYGIFCRDH